MTEFGGFANIFTDPTANFIATNLSNSEAIAPDFNQPALVPISQYSYSYDFSFQDIDQNIDQNLIIESDANLVNYLLLDQLDSYSIQTSQLSQNLNETDYLNPGFNVSSDFDGEYGFGLVDAAAAISLALGLKSPLADVADPLINSYGAALVSAPEAWIQGYTGKGVVVAVIDTGIDLNHVDLVNSFWRNSDEIAGDGVDNDRNGYIDDINGYDFASRDSNPINSSSREIHGTHVAGIITANRNGANATDRNNTRYEVTGIAYDAQIMAVRVLDSNGRGSAQSVAQGIRYAADNGADVINLSLGSPMTSGIELDALRYAEGKGVIVVSASGNSGYTSVLPDFPARLASTNDFGIAVGAVDRNKQVASFSNPAGELKSQYPFVVAPGVSILSTTPNNNYSFLSGTSMATPHVSGVIALMLEANPNLTPAQIKTIISQTANPNVLAIA
jgi:subtilisin family serine protease